jgi:hypothetical protein
MKANKCVAELQSQREDGDADVAIAMPKLNKTTHAIEQNGSSGVHNKKKCSVYEDDSAPFGGCDGSSVSESDEETCVWKDATWKHMWRIL